MGKLFSLSESEFQFGKSNLSVTGCAAYEPGLERPSRVILCVSQPCAVACFVAPSLFETVPKEGIAHAVHRISLTLVQKQNVDRRSSLLCCTGAGSGGWNCAQCHIHMLF